jgi:hypothetical protein
VNHCCRGKAINITYLCVRAHARAWVWACEWACVRAALLIQDATRMRHCIGGWLSPKVVLDWCGKSSPPLPQPGVEPRTAQPIVSLYTDYSILAMNIYIFCYESCSLTDGTTLSEVRTAFMFRLCSWWRVPNILPPSSEFNSENWRKTYPRNVDSTTGAFQYVQNVSWAKFQAKLGNT